MSRLRDLLAPSLSDFGSADVLAACQQACADQKSSLDHVKGGDWLFFTVARANPSKSHLQKCSPLKGTDIGISIHQLTGRAAPCKAFDKNVLVSTMPVAMKHDVVATNGDDLSGLAMVLSLGLLPLSVLLRARVCDTADIVHCQLDDKKSDGSALPEPPREHAHLVPQLFAEMIHAAGRYCCADSEHRIVYEALLHHYELVDVVSKCFDGFVPYWGITEAGQRRLRLSYIVTGSVKLLGPRPLARRGIPLHELSTFELLRKLEAASFRCVVYPSSERKAWRKSLKTVAYVHVGEKSCTCATQATWRGHI